MTETTHERLTAILVEQLGVTPEQCTLDTLLVPDTSLLHSDRPNLGLDSLDVVELVMEAEEQFGVFISDDEAEPLNHGTVRDCCDLIDRKLAE